MATKKVKKDTSAKKNDIPSLLAACLKNAKSGKNILSGLDESAINGLKDVYSEFVDENDKDGYLSNSKLQIKTISTPRPYYHGLNNGVIGQNAYGCCLDQALYGYSFLNTIEGGNITKMAGPYAKPILRKNGEIRQILLREEDAKGSQKDSEGNNVEIWSPFPTGCTNEKNYKNYLCEQSPIDQTIKAEFRDISTTTKTIIPDGETFEIIELEFENSSSKKRAISVFFKIEWGLTPYTPECSTGLPYIRQKFDKSSGALVAENLSSGKINRRVAFIASDKKVESYETSLSRYVCESSEPHMPKAVVDNSLSSLDYTIAGDENIGAIKVNIAIPAKGKTTIKFILGATTKDLATTCAYVKDSKKKFLSASGFKNMIQEKVASWDKFKNAFMVETPDVEFNRFFNVWLPAQLLNVSSFLNGGAYVEFREKMRTLAALSSRRPEFVKEDLDKNACYHLKDGRALSHYSIFENVLPGETVKMDNTVWMVEAMLRYMNESGDYDFADESIGFYDTKLRTIDRRRGLRVYEHIMSSIKCLFEYRGRFGLCKVGSGDQISALNNISKMGGVSAFVSMLLVYLAKRLYFYARQRNIKRDIGYLNTIIENMNSNMNNYVWNNTGFTYAFDDEGEPIGGGGSDEGAFFLLSNLGSLLSGTAEHGGKEKEILKLLDKAKTTFGIPGISPAYKSEDGYINDVQAGHFSNGAINLVDSSFAVFTFANLKMGARAVETIKSMLPDSTLPDIDTSNPNQLSEFTIGPDSPEFGKKQYDIYNPSISLMIMGMERMMGIDPTPEGIVIDPIASPDWKEFRVKKIFRGRTLDLRYINPKGVESGVVKLTINGTEIKPEDVEKEVFLIPKKTLFATSGNAPICIDVLMG